MDLTLQIPSLEEPLTLEEVKSYLKISTTYDDEHLQALISTARASVESLTGRALLKQKWRLSLKPPYPKKSPLVKRDEKILRIELPRPPLLAIESVKHKDKDISYQKDEKGLTLSSQFWEMEIQIDFWAGYGEKRNSLPPDLKMAVLRLTRYFEDQQSLDLDLLKPFKVFHLI